MKQYHRFLTYLGDKEASGIIRVQLPYILLNLFDDVIANYDFILHPEESFYNNLSILQVQRQCTPIQYDAISGIKNRFNKQFKIFYDIDDWILGLPEYNHAYEYFHQHRDMILKILEKVDCIICSTPELASYMSKFNKTKIIKNRLMKGLWGNNEQYDDIPEKPIILWAGGVHHFGSNDGDFSEDIIKYIEKTTNKYTWTFVGSLPLKLKDNKDIIFYPWSNYFEYSNLLKKIKPYLGIALLKDNIFNRCKSNIKALEYTSLNITGIYSNMPMYRDMYNKINNCDQFIYNIEKLTTDFDYYKLSREKDKLTLKDNMYWDDNYMKRYLKTYLAAKI